MQSEARTRTAVDAYRPGEAVRAPNPNSGRTPAVAARILILIRGALPITLWGRQSRAQLHAALARQRQFASHRRGRGDNSGRSATRGCPETSGRASRVPPPPCYANQTATHGDAAPSPSPPPPTSRAARQPLPAARLPPAGEDRPQRCRPPGPGDSRPPKGQAARRRSTRPGPVAAHLASNGGPSRARSAPAVAAAPLCGRSAALFRSAGRHLPLLGENAPPGPHRAGAGRVSSLN